MRLGRLFLGLTIVTSALRGIIDEQITGVSSDAVVNARLTTVRAAIAGTLEMPTRPFGSAVKAGEKLPTLNVPLPNDGQLNDLRMGQAFTAAEIARLVSFGAGEDTATASLTDIGPDLLANSRPRTDTGTGH